MRVGASIAGSRSLLDDVFRVKQILDEMVLSTKYFTNNCFNTQVVPELQRIVKNIIQHGVNVDVEAYRAIREAMEKRLKSVPYWRLVANAGASRGFHYGVVKAGMITGQRAYEIVAVVDKQTSEICRHMNGKQFRLADAELQVTRAVTQKEPKSRKYRLGFPEQKLLASQTMNRTKPGFWFRAFMDIAVQLSSSSRGSNGLRI
ncbi:MAG: hypothetical protein ACREXW_01225 [Gammaproteobacteria bacterium]